MAATTTTGSLTFVRPFDRAAALALFDHARRRGLVLVHDLYSRRDFLHGLCLETSGQAGDEMSGMRGVSLFWFYAILEVAVGCQVGLCSGPRVWPGAF